MKENAADSKTREQTGHTPGPWRIGEQCVNEREKLDTGDQHYPIFWPDCGCGAHVFRKADAERIVACVNALAGIANPSAVAGLVEAARDLVTAFYNGKDDEKGAKAFTKIESSLRALDSTVPKEE